MLKIISYKYFKISLQIYVGVVRNKEKPAILHWKQTICFSAIGIFLPYIPFMSIWGAAALNPGHIKGARFFGRAISEISGR